LPPLGYGINSVTGDLDRTDVIKRSTVKAAQHWERTPLPDGWNKKRKIELEKQKDDPEYVNKELEEYREQEWRRRLCGVWFYNNGVPTYITGEHYMFLNWWYLDDGYPKYREPDRRRYYFLQYCIEDPRCAGMIEAANRRSGKSFRGGLFVYEYISRTMDAVGGMQSKTDADARNLFKGKVITPFRRLPDFFRPEIDTAAGSNPDKELKMMKTAKRGKRALEDFDNLGLNSVINYLSSELYAYDGWKVHRYLGDEVGKTAEVDVYDRHTVVKYCLRVGKQWVGKALYTTTVEKMKEDKTIRTPAFRKLWNHSDPSERDENGHTKTGLYRYFTPAYEMLEYDEYGMPLVDENKAFFINTRAALSNDPRALAAEIAKNPFTEAELFYDAAETCLFDAMKLNIQKDAISWKENLTERGNFVWENGERFTKVKWERSPTGRFTIYTGFQFRHEEDANKVIRQGDYYLPNNNHLFAMGCDPFKYDKVKDNRRSDCAAFVYKKYDPSDPKNLFNDAPVCKYTFRAPTTTFQYEDLLKMAWYFGCQILFERNIDGWKEYFVHQKCHNFLMKLPGEEDYGLYSDGKGRTIQLISDFTESYINEFIHQVYYTDLIDEWLEFDPGATTKFDRTIGFGMTLIAAKRHRGRNFGDGVKKFDDYFKLYKAI
jgi:hypothetical protein